MKKKLTSALSLLSFFPVVAYGAGDRKITENTDGSLVEFLSSIQSWLVGIVGGLAVLFIVYGGFLYVTSGGNQQKVDTAKKTLTYAIGGLMVVVLAGLIFNIITGDFLSSIFGDKTLSY